MPSYLAQLSALHTFRASNRGLAATKGAEEARAKSKDRMREGIVTGRVLTKVILTDRTEKNELLV